MWNVILSDIKEDKVMPSPNNPVLSGEYVCTCIARIGNTDTLKKYIRVMEFDVTKNHWHDIGNPHGLSHTILAWRYIEVCGFEDFNYETGVVLTK